MKKQFRCKSRSSFVSAVAYDNGRLSVSLQGNPAIYEYFFVPAKVFDKMQKSESVGAFFCKHIKGKYPSRKAEEK